VLAFLSENNIRYYIRIRNNFNIYSYQKQKEIKAFWLFNTLKRGEFYHYSKIVGLHDQRCYLSGTKTIDKEGENGVLNSCFIQQTRTSNGLLQAAMADRKSF